MDGRTHSITVGLNPYGLTWTLGLQGAGTSRANPNPGGLEGFVVIATGIGARLVELHDPWLEGWAPRDVEALGERLRAAGLLPVASSALFLGAPERAVERARLLGAPVLRMALTPVLCGNRAERPDWAEIVSQVRAGLRRLAPLAAGAGLSLAVENHQDFGSDELMDLCEEAGEMVGVCLDTANALAVGEAPLDFARTVAPRVRHVHLKDYRVRFTDEGLLLCRCAVGDGAVPNRAILDVLAAQGSPRTASLELAALDARHVRLLTPGWWQGYAARDARTLAACFLAARPNRIGDEEDHRTPWESGAPGEEVGRYELAMIERSASLLRATSIMT